MARFVWTPERLQSLRNLYPDYTADVVARVIGCSPASVWAKANREGLGKSTAFLASQQSGRIQRGKQLPSIVTNQFKPGQTSWNKGTHYKAGGRSAETRFKKGAMSGAAQHNYKPIGTLRINADGHLERKTTDDPNLMPTRRWTPVYRLVWEAANGPIPKGHMVVFKPGQRTAVEADITTDRLECITKAENARRNHPANKSPELARLVQLKGAITRQVNRINREHAENQGATQ